MFNPKNLDKIEHVDNSYTDKERESLTQHLKHATNAELLENY